uniref:DNA-directed RNA polymerase subunit n=1 Tax=Ophirina amphinema TaxID=2108040 RepID=A0A348AYQ1_9EUKA|nr:RNA polymerase subunit beta [Ophirina amphinema]
MGSFGLVVSILDINTILSQSSGSITTTKYYESNDQIPAFQGLFCSYTFGKKHLIRCRCGRFKNKVLKYYPPCSNCLVSGFKLTGSSVSYRIGHLNFPEPVLHPWFIDWVCSVLKLSIFDIKQILSYKYPLFTKSEKLIRFFVATRTLQVRKLNSISLQDPTELSSVYYKEIVGSGHRFLKYLFQLVYISHIRRLLFLQSAERLNLDGKINVLRSVSFHGIPIISPEYRPLLKVIDSNGSLLSFSSDLNTHYLKLLSYANNSFYLSKLSLVTYQSAESFTGRWVTLNGLHKMQSQFGGYIESLRCLQEGVQSFVGGSSSLKLSHGLSKGSLNSRSVLSLLSRKEGLLRRDLLGRRVNYSGRSVISSGRHLRLTQCGVPWEISLELYRPLFVSLMWNTCLHGGDQRYRGSGMGNLRLTELRDILLTGHKYWYSILYKVVSSHPVLLNRAPTLHRYNIQSFEGVLSTQRTIQLHPLVCSSFNADFDGDQMAIYLPHSISSQVESRDLLSPVAQVLSLASDNSMITASQDIVFGIYFATLSGSSHTYNENSFRLHERVVYRCPLRNKRYKTTRGRLLLYSMVRDFLPFRSINRTFNKSSVGWLINVAWKSLSKANFERFSFHLMSFGFYNCYKSGISFHKSYLEPPYIRNQLIKEARSTISLARAQHLNLGKVKQLVVSKWASCLAQLLDTILADVRNAPWVYNSTLYLLVDSKARGSVVQLRQLCAFRGLVMKPSGEIMEIPILSNLGDGLSPFEYFLSAHGSRKGVIDTSIKTAVAGYLTRRLINSSNDVQITELDCGYDGSGIFVSKEQFKSESEFFNHIKYKVTAQNVYSWEYSTVKLILAKGQMIDDHFKSLLEEYNIEYLYLRNVIVCQSDVGLCAKCYGMDLSTRKLPDLGSNVGVIAGQSIGEPGTQLTMRTFHSGGVASSSSAMGFILSKDFCRILIKGSVVKHSVGSLEYSRVISRTARLYCIDSDMKLIRCYDVGYGFLICKSDGSQASMKAKLFRDTAQLTLYSNVGGYVRFIKEASNFRVLQVSRSIPCVGNNLLPDKFAESYIIPVGYTVYVSPGEHVRPGSKLASLVNGQLDQNDITGGLPRVSRLLEFNDLEGSAYKSMYNGFISLSLKGNHLCLQIWSLPRWSCDRVLLLNLNIHLSSIIKIHVQSNQFIRAGDVVISCHKGLKHDVSMIMNSNIVERRYSDFSKNVLNIYKDNGISLDSKHLDVVLSKGFSFVRQVRSNDMIDRMTYKRLLVSYLANGDFNELKGYLFVPVGITFSGLNKRSGMSSASFQKVNEGVTGAVLKGGSDLLSGSQEQILMDRKLSSGTGLLAE